MMTTVMVINISSQIVTFLCLCVCMCVMETPEIYSISKFPVLNTVLLTVVIIMDINISTIIHSI